jgi:hypothetical protein
MNCRFLLHETSQEGLCRSSSRIWGQEAPCGPLHLHIGKDIEVDHYGHEFECCREQQLTRVLCAALLSQ